MKLNSAILKDLKRTLFGRLKLKLFQNITGVPDEMPLKRKIIQYADEVRKSAFVTYEMIYYLLVDQRYCPIDYGSCNAKIEIDDLFNQLDQYPLKKPFFFEISGFKKQEPIGVLVACHELAGLSGHFYTISMVTERSFEELMFYAEIRTSADHPEPAFTFEDHGQTKKLDKVSEQLISDEMLQLSLQVLHYLSLNHVDTLIHINEYASQKAKKINIEGGGPSDPIFDQLIRQVYLGEKKCHLAYLKIGDIRPFSFDHCLNIPLHQINSANSSLEEFKKYGIIVYWKNDHFVLSDDYSVYIAHRIAGNKSVKAIILGDNFPKSIKLQASGGIELIPPVVRSTREPLDQMEADLGEFYLARHIAKLAALDKLSTMVHAKVVVLTEDTKTDYLEILLASNGFNLDETTVMSYQNCTKLDLLPLTIQTLKKIASEVKFVIHRDRDYLVDLEIQKIEKKMITLGANPFITEGTDLESYFLNPEFLCEQFGLNIEESLSLIEQATELTSKLSITRLYSWRDPKNAKVESNAPEAFTDLYNSNTKRYRIGKITLSTLRGILQKRLKKNPQLLEVSKFLKDDSLRKLAENLWDNN